MIAIYEITIAPWGDDYRFVTDFNSREDAEKVWAVLEKVNFDVTLYAIVEWEKDVKNGKS